VKHLRLFLALPFVVMAVVCLGLAAGCVLMAQVILGQ